MRSIEIDRQWVMHFDPSDIEEIAEARSARRRAGRALGVKIITHQRGSALRKDGKVVVVAVNQDETDPEEEKRLKEQTSY
ncbi:hypothetical protein AB0L57_32225 [Nocardia sp. NPDC052254]|uniref:hypothetical protein n=1 Tax=Nocardia sp. NPDC052254 TaxID=3155681 RepID=UPI00341700CC